MKLKTFLPCAALLVAPGAAGIAAAASAPVAVRAELDRPFVMAGQGERVVIKVSLLPAETESARARPPVNLALALDRSGSMSGQKIEQAREAALEALSLLGPRDRIALVVYDDEAFTLIESQHPLERERLAAAIRGIRPGGSTALYSGVRQAAAQVREGSREGSIDRVVLLSDGQANVGPSSPEALRDLGLKLAAEDISVSTVGLGAGFNEDLMTGLAETGQGNSYFVENARDLTRIFAAELEDVLNVAATGVEVVVTFEPGVRPVRIIGREGRIGDGDARFSVNQLIGGREKFALIEVELPAGEAGVDREIARVRADYTDALSGEKAHADASAQVAYTERPAEVESAANVIVGREVVANRVAEARREAVKLSDAGQHREAAALFRDLRGEIDVMNAPYADSEITQMSEVLDRDAAQLDQSKLSNTDRKRYSNDSYKTVNQQRDID
ncbi:VWA domain-containing protein [Ruficoccus amylovorans]|uniref:VWA domain-containing protein n=1 Tax=Ruficoccus amylovorans TaxID=1804625 RepID=A0A842HEI0_9BACT|nr:VWA domain-containing protein [Ruficoccus amylovorans]MBC2593934.1 VWA domain-containing protein [Ruficoccus amylovorans]